MIVPDLNLLVYTYNADAPQHRAARDWWEEVMSGPMSVGLAWAVTMGYVRIMTSRTVLIDPISPAEAVADIRTWLERPQVQILQPGPRHLDLFESLAAATGTAGRMTTDIHLAALAIESQAELHSNDADFSRFPGLRWRNPLAKPPAAG